MVGRMFRTIFWNMLAIVRLRYVIFTLAFFLFLGFVSAREASERAVLDTGSDRTTVWELFLWLLPVQGCETPRWSECSDGFFPT